MDSLVSFLFRGEREWTKSLECKPEPLEMPLEMCINYGGVTERSENVCHRGLSLCEKYHSYELLFFPLLSAMASTVQGEELDCFMCLNIDIDPLTLRCGHIFCQLQCLIYLNFYPVPVTVLCGHNLCRVSIDQLLDTQDNSVVSSSSECRAKFQEQPSRSNVAENFLSTHPDHEEVKMIRCTYCIHSPVPAVKSCLLCEASLCDNHLRVHNKEPEHVLTDPSSSLENKKCSEHRKILEYYCTEDAACICVSCYLIGKHRGHKLQSLDEVSKKKKEKWRHFFKKLITKKEENEERVWSLEERRRKAQEKTAGKVENVTALFIDIRRRVDDLEKRVLSEISWQKEEALLSHMIQKLEIQMDELSRKMRHIEELCNMTDPLTVLLEPDTEDLCDPEKERGDEDTGGHDGGDVDTGGHDGGDDDTGEHDGGDVDTGGHDGGDEDTGGHDGGDEDTRDGGDQGAELISHISHTLSAMIRDVNVIFYVQDPADILLDVNTADNNLLISDDLKTATRTEITQNRPETAERFQYNQVMSRRGFTSGRHYWDVEISASPRWRVGMCYPSIDRRGPQSYIGYNKSWGLYGGQVYNNRCSVIHDSEEIRLPYWISSDKFRIYVDYKAGQLSFYELCDPIRHLHTFTAAFTEPLHAVLCIWEGYIKLFGSGTYEEPLL
ncbi:E3 ubiquitin/ISG15 ligase TRIM25-like [Phyllobates terribilis]|uniref:E3 ubiquitin/ISG15 ligase TRIM25-like n=1 Tax=Phyllobates terribilis TaxID=111132 RepID=UPI003CCB616C